MTDLLSIYRINGKMPLDFVNILVKRPACLQFSATWPLDTSQNILVLSM